MSNIVFDIYSPISIDGLATSLDDNGITATTAATTREESEPTQQSLTDPEGFQCVSYVNEMRSSDSFNSEESEWKLSTGSCQSRGSYACTHNKGDCRGRFWRKLHFINTHFQTCSNSTFHFLQIFWDFTELMMSCLIRIMSWALKMTEWRSQCA